MSARGVYPFSTHWGGVEKSFFYLSKYLVEEGNDVEIITPAICGGKGMGSVLYEGIKYTFLPPATFPEAVCYSWVMLLPFSFNLARYLRKKEFDVLHSYDITPYFYLRYKNRAPVIVTPYLLYKCGSSTDPTKGVDKWIEILIKQPGRYFVRRPLIKYLLFHGDAIVSEGEFQTEEMVRMYGVDRQKFINLPPAVNISYAKEALQTRLFSRAKLGLDNNDLVLISVNRLSAEKGVRFLMDALSLIRQRIKNVKLILVGTGPEESRIIDQIRRYRLTKNVIHFKNVSEENLYTCYGLSDIYISPTLQTDFIQGIEEAMACGLPVVSTGQDWLVKSGVNGFVVPQRSPQMIAEAVFKIYEENLGEKMGARSEEIVKEYDWKVVARKIIRKYEDLLR